MPKTKCVEKIYHRNITEYGVTQEDETTHRQHLEELQNATAIYVQYIIILQQTRHRNNFTELFTSAEDIKDNIQPLHAPNKQNVIS